MILVPVVTDDYKYTKKIDDEVQYKLKDCVVGETYKYPNDKPMIYLGYLRFIVCKISGGYDNIYIQPSYFDNFEKSVKLVNESGFEFIT